MKKIMKVQEKHHKIKLILVNQKNSKYLQEPNKNNKKIIRMKK